MASLRAPSAHFLSAFLPVARASLIPQQAVRRIPLLHQIQQRLNATILPAALVPIPALLGELWDGLLKAVPKKKTSHMKKRHRQMAGKALKDVTALNKCSACGRVKRAHILCPHCVLSIRQWFGNGFKSKQALQRERAEQFEIDNAKRVALGKKPMKWVEDEDTKA
ncbi:related to ribosomal protein YmL32 precursor (mitochondrial) [Ramularia collo-cygni]|uniref:Large ribosomal subunit protein bL32m n=1 Tax=Ramularia collo-cygni TaxID=112498 RepID=A0A2D3VQ97_9PEZI|nr:related to ribosomal protein YmL32 precursor (mitochondrial) [Ramularia collo-cygni]CZT25424.1 related to ribosomal protein YmL32 precursor (mitochondrial) [Ramularia collo-cygni]